MGPFLSKFDQNSFRNEYFQQIKLAMKFGASYLKIAWKRRRPLGETESGTCITPKHMKRVVPTES